MHNHPLSRRDFLKLGLSSLGSLALKLPGEHFDLFQAEDVARVCIDSISVYSKPSDKSRILYQRFRDDLVHIYYDVISEYGPGYNPLWYRVWGGYVHSARLQRIKPAINTPILYIDKPLLAEVTVPYSQALRYTSYSGWQPVYRLYFKSNHWITGVDEGPDGTPWYKLQDELLDIDYHAPATHLRVISLEELTPISPEIPPEVKHIEVSITKQTLTAYEGDKVVLNTKISSGVPSYERIPGLIPTATPLGTFHIQSKMPSKHMGGGELTAAIDYYVLPGVPWTSFFETKTGIAFHGTYWHNNFGVPMSRGCINMRNEEAKWIFRWSTPVVPADSQQNVGWGTLVRVYQ